MLVSRNLYYTNRLYDDVLKKKDINQKFDTLISAISLNSAQEEPIYKEIYIKMGRLIGTSLKNGESKLSNSMKNWLNNFDNNSSIKSVTPKRAKVLKESFYKRIASSCNEMINNSNFSNFENCIKIYNTIINLDDSAYSFYRGKYLLLGHKGEYGKSINVIIDYFNKNTTTRDKTLRLLKDWNLYISLYTKFKGSNADIKEHKENIEYKKIWISFYNVLDNYIKSYGYSKFPRGLKISYDNAKEIVSS
jgi:hypothetical protein